MYVKLESSVFQLLIRPTLSSLSFLNWVIRGKSTSLLKTGPIPALFVYFRPFLITISIMQIEESIDGGLGTRARGRRMVGANETTELWWAPRKNTSLLIKKIVVKASSGRTKEKTLSEHWNLSPFRYTNSFFFFSYLSLWYSDWALSFLIIVCFTRH